MENTSGEPKSPEKKKQKPDNDVDGAEKSGGVNPMASKGHIFINGRKIPNMVPLDISPEDHVRQLIAMEIREDDVLVAAFPKCGTHWLWEVVYMLINKTTTHEKRAKEFAMMEFTAVQDLNQQPSPRVLNSHMAMVHLPEALVSKNTKIVHVVRNPKDVLVSMYYHWKTLFPHLTWESLLEDLITGPREISDQFGYLQQMQQFQQSHPNHPVKTVYYEQVKKDPVGVIKELAEFLCATNTDEFYQSVADACSFDTMKKADKTKDFPEEILQKTGFDKPEFYRKGVIGDWRNHFTVAQNERMDKLIEQELTQLPYKFVYQ